jgi:hypothetical protein
MRRTSSHRYKSTVLLYINKEAGSWSLTVTVHGMCASCLVLFIRLHKTRQAAHDLRCIWASSINTESSVRGDEKTQIFCVTT